MWFEQIERLYLRRSAASENGSCAPFRSAFHLLQLAPRPLRGVLPGDHDEPAIEALLARGALLDAAIALFAAPLGVTLARDTAGERFDATVVILGASAKGSDADADPARALLGAWCQASLALGGPLPRKPSLERGSAAAGRRASPSFH
jgi:hypothetical protein